MNIAQVKIQQPETEATDSDTMIVCDVAAGKVSELRAFLQMSKLDRNVSSEIEFVEYLLSMTHMAICQISAKTLIDQGKDSAG